MKIAFKNIAHNGAHWYKIYSMDESTFNYLVWAWIFIALIVFPFQFKTTAPYGRHTRKGWGPLMDNRLGWILMEFWSKTGKEKGTFYVFNIW